MRSARIDRKGAREGALTLILLLAAILLGMHLRTPSPKPASYCTAGNHVTVTATDARTVLGAPECR